MQKLFLLLSVGVMLSSVVAKSAQTSPKRLHLQPNVDQGCPAVDPMGYTVLLPDPTECSKFYMCSHGEAIPMDCPNDLHFNPKKHVCDYPDSANCEASTSLKFKMEDTKSEVSQKQDQGCPAVDPMGYTVLLPDPTDCSKFFMCSNGEAIPMDCPDGLHFNPKKHVCDYPDNANCEASTSLKFKMEDTKSEVSQKQDQGCPAVDPMGYTVLLPDPTDCSKFYMCSNGEAIPMDCPDGLHFNPKKHVCDYPGSANCEASTSLKFKMKDTKSEVSQKQDQGCPAVDPMGYTVLLPEPTDCSKFYMCSNGEAIPMDCPDGLHFNPKKNVCDYPDSANCEASTPLKSKMEETKSEGTEKLGKL